MERLGVKDELTALGEFVGGGERYLAAELVRFVGFTLADALGLRRVPGIKLPAALALFLPPNLRGLGYRRDRLQHPPHPQVAEETLAPNHRRNIDADKPVLSAQNGFLTSDLLTSDSLTA